MKRLVVFLLVSLLFAATASAQATIKPVVYAGGGLVLPMSPETFSDYWKMSYNLGGGFGLQINPQLEVIAKVFFNTFPFDDEKFLEELGVSGATVEGLDFRAMEFGVDVKYLFSVGEEGAAFKPFVVVGVGMANAKFTDATISAGGQSLMLPASEISETKVAFGGGVGFDYMFTPMAGLWLEGRFSLVSTSGESTTYIPIRAGLKLAFGE